MSITICASNHAEWRKYNLADYGEFAECVTDCNQEDWNDHTSGEWFYAPESPQWLYAPESPMVSCDRVIYHGSWGNDNAPGASSYTYAELYDMFAADDCKQYAKDLARWESCPEWVTEFCDECGEPLDDGECDECSETAEHIETAEYVDDTSDDSPNGWTASETSHD